MSDLSFYKADKLPFLMRHPNLRIFRKLRGLWERLLRCLNILPTVWNTYDWDYSSVLELTKWQLKRMEPVIRGGHCEGGEKTADKIKQATVLLERILSQDYLSETGHTAIQQKWRNKTEVADSDGNTHMTFVDDPSLERLIKQEFELAAQKEHKDWNDFFTILRRNLKRWWD